MMQDKETTLIKTGVMHRRQSRHIPRYQKYTDGTSTDDDTIIDQPITKPELKGKNNKQQNNFTFDS